MSGRGEGRFESFDAAAAAQKEVANHVSYFFLTKEWQRYTEILGDRSLKTNHSWRLLSGNIFSSQ